MTDKDIGSATAGVDAKAAYTVDPASIEGAHDQKETRWQNKNWTNWHGYFIDIPEMVVIDVKATWTVGKGFKADEETTMLLDTIKGNGFDTFNTILENMIRTYHIGGDSYSHKVYDDEGNLTNLKPLDPERMTHIADEQGMLIAFEYSSRIAGGAPFKRFDADEIFYLARNRLADQIHGTSMVERLTKIVLAKNEAQADWKRALHMNVEPMLLVKLSTDNVVKIAAIKAKIDAARTASQSVFYIPMGSVEIENITVAPNATMNPLPTIQMYNDMFYKHAGVPQIVVGGVGGITERAVTIAYLAFQQTIEEEQLFIEEQVLSQLNLVIELEFPASLQNDLLTDQRKDGAINIDQSETTATEERA